MITMIELRSQQNLDRVSFASTLAITPQMVGLIEDGMVNPGKEIIQKVKEKYGYEIEPYAGKEAEGKSRITGQPITIKELRKATGLSQVAFSKIIGCSHQSVIRFEKFGIEPVVNPHLVLYQYERSSEQKL